MKKTLLAVLILAVGLLSAKQVTFTNNSGQTISLKEFSFDEDRPYVSNNLGSLVNNQTSTFNVNLNELDVLDSTGFPVIPMSGLLNRGPISFTLRSNNGALITYVK